MSYSYPQSLYVKGRWTCTTSEWVKQIFTCWYSRKQPGETGLRSWSQSPREKRLQRNEMYSQIWSGEKKQNRKWYNNYTLNSENTGVGLLRWWLFQTLCVQISDFVCSRMGCRVYLILLSSAVISFNGNCETLTSLWPLVDACIILAYTGTHYTGSLWRESGWWRGLTGPFQHVQTEPSSARRLPSSPGTPENGITSPKQCSGDNIVHSQVYI